jgi:ribonucleoside-diphosphate reductase alpha chain
MARTPMPSRRNCVTQRVSIDGQKLYLTIGFSDEANTQVGEVFLVLQKTGAQERALYDEIARSASKRLQLGESLDALALSWLGTKLKPCGPVEGDARIKLCNGPLDWAGRHLLIHYCQREDLAHAKASV